MRITSIEANNFKSLVNFRLDLAKFSCLVGLNGSGKSTVLQFVDFLAQQARGDIDQWLKKRDWKPRDIPFALDTKKTVRFTVNAVDSQEHELVWCGVFNSSGNRLRCTDESIKTHDAELRVASENYSITNHRGRKSNRKSIVSEEIRFNYQGSILSQLTDNALPESLLKFKRFLLQIESLDMLTPERLRQRTREADGSLGHGGRNLSAFVYELGADGRTALAARLRKAYGNLDHVYAKSLRSGWKQLQVREMFGKQKLRTEGRHVNDGMLRLIAVFAELATEKALLLFDEVENGINPEVVEFVMDALVEASQQVVVTTHSPMVLNFLKDDVARRGVIYLFKNRRGHTQSLPLFSIPSLAEKLKYMGPGEAYADTKLVELADEIPAAAKRS